MKKLSALYSSLFQSPDPSPIDESLTEVIGIMNLEQLEDLRKRLDEHFDTMYKAS